MATGVCNVRDACRGAASGVIVHVVGAMCCASADQGHGALGGWAVYVLSSILRLWFGLERPKKKIRRTMGTVRWAYGACLDRTPVTSRERPAPVCFGYAENYARHKVAQAT